MNQLQFKVGDKVKVITTADDSDKVALEKIGYVWKINQFDSFPYFVDIDVPGKDKTIWVFADWQLMLLEDTPKATKKEDNMSLVHEVNNLDLTADERLFRKHGLKDSQGGITEEGVNVLSQVLFKENEEKIASLLKKIDKENEKKKK